MTKQIAACCGLVALLMSGCAEQPARTPAAALTNAYLKVDARAAKPWNIVIYYRRESDETNTPLSPQGLRRNHQAEIVVDKVDEVTSIVQAISRTKKVRSEALQLNARWAIVFENSEGQDIQAFYVDPRGWVTTGSSEYVTDGTLLAFLRKKLSCVTHLVGA